MKDALFWLDEIEKAQGGANGPTIKLRAALMAAPVAAPEPAPSSQQAERFADIGHYLNEAHQFAAMSPRGRDSIGIALAMLDEMEALAQQAAPAPAVPQHIRGEAAKGMTLQEMRERISPGLVDLGDVRLMWVNEGDWIMRNTKFVQPLATAPGLTDEQIIAIMRDGYNCNYNDEKEHVDFARAILAARGAA